MFLLEGDERQQESSVLAVPEGCERIVSIQPPTPPEPTPYKAPSLHEGKRALILLAYDILSCWPMTWIGGIALWAPASINEKIQLYHMYQVLGVPVHVIVPRNLQ